MALHQQMALRQQMAQWGEFASVHGSTGVDYNPWNQSYLHNFTPSGPVSSVPVPLETNSSLPVPKPTYNYRVKLINPNKKKDTMTMELHDVNRKFVSPDEIKLQLIDSLKDLVPPETALKSFTIGYFRGSKQEKQWIVTDGDLKAMYSCTKEGNVFLWCDKRVVTDSEAESSSRASRKRSNDDPTPLAKKATAYAAREGEIEDVADELKELHGNKYSYPQYKLWARMLQNGQHKDKDKPPNVPLITGSYVKERKDSGSVGEAIAGAAIAIVKALKGSPQKTETQSLPTGISPGKKVQLSTQYLEQPETIQKLKDDGVLSAEEYIKQKHRIMNNLEVL